MTAYQPRTASAETLVRGCPESVWAVALALTERLWPDRAATVVSMPPNLLVLAIDGDDGVDGWLTWEARPAVAGWLRVRVTYDDADLAPAPDADLDALLAALLEAGESARLAD